MVRSPSAEVEGRFALVENIDVIFLLVERIKLRERRLAIGDGRFRTVHRHAHRCRFRRVHRLS